MEKIRAVYVGDVRLEQCPAFELNVETNNFEMLIDREFKYPRECVEEDDGFLIFKIENDTVRLINK